MCGRYSIAVEPTEIEERFRAGFAKSPDSVKPRYNAAPSQQLPVILNADPRQIVLAQWGIKPEWMSRVGRKDGLINVRLETLRDKATFRSDLERRRCLVPADGFYEWKTPSGARRVPFRITRKDGKLFAFAGIWQENRVAGDLAPRFVIITTEANELGQPIHGRMPVILDEEGEPAWLSHETRPLDLIRLMEMTAKLSLVAYEVSREVNRASTDTPELIKPVTGVCGPRSG